MNKEQKTVTYCAWCTRLPTGTRKEGVFYTSEICEKHLEELRNQNYINKGKHREE